MIVALGNSRSTDQTRRPIAIGNARHARLMFRPGVGLVSDGGAEMDILAVIVVLLLLLFLASWSSVRSYFAKGRLAGMEEATREVIRGIRSHFEVAGQDPPDHVAKAVEAISSFARSRSCEKSIHRYQTLLWTFGDAVGAACWRKGYETCQRKMSPRADRIRLELPMADLQEIAALAHLGFKKMMPNDRGIELARFGSEEHALAVTRAVERLEQAIPREHRPSGHSVARQVLIQHWWERKRA